MESSRREFLTAGLASALAASVLARPPSKSHKRGKGGEGKTYVLDEFFVAGFRYHDGPELLHQMSKGARLALVAEPENPYDPEAVAIRFRGRHVGYVPRARNHMVFQLLEQGATVRGRVTLVDSQADPWEALQVQVLLTLA